MAAVNGNLKKQLEHALLQLTACLHAPGQFNDTHLQLLTSQVAAAAREFCRENEKQLDHITKELANFNQIQRWSRVMDMPREFDRMKDEFRDRFARLGQMSGEVLDDSLQVKMRKWPDRIQQRNTELADQLADVIRLCEQFPDVSVNVHLRPLFELLQQCKLDLQKLFSRIICIVSQPGKVMEKDKGHLNVTAIFSKFKKNKSTEYTMEDIEHNDYLLAARFLIGDAWKDYIKISEMTAQIISLSDAQDLESGRKKLSQIPIVGYMEKKSNDVITPTFVNLNGSDVAVFTVRNPSRKKASTGVSKSFYCFLLKTKCQLSSEQAFEIYTTSSIFGLICNTSQANQYRSGTVWNYLFADGLQVDVDVPMNKFLNSLGKYFLFYTGAEKGLDPDELMYLGHKIQAMNNEVDINTVLLKQDSIKNIHKNGSPAKTMFWDWFFMVMNMIKNHFLHDWNSRLLRFAERATAENSLRNVSSKCGYVRFPETFEEALCFDVVNGNAGDGVCNCDHFLLKIAGTNRGFFKSNQANDIIKLISITKDMEGVTDIYPNHKIELLKAQREREKEESQDGPKRKPVSQRSPNDNNSLYEKEMYKLLKIQFILTTVETAYKKVQLYLGTESKTNQFASSSSPKPSSDNFVSRNTSLSTTGMDEADTQMFKLTQTLFKFQTREIACQNIHQLISQNLDTTTCFVEYFQQKLNAHFVKQTSPGTCTNQNSCCYFVNSVHHQNCCPKQQFAANGSKNSWIRGSQSASMISSASGSGLVCESSTAEVGVSMAQTMGAVSSLQYSNLQPNLIQSFAYNPMQTIQHIKFGNNYTSYDGNVDGNNTLISTEQQSISIGTGISSQESLLSHYVSTQIGLSQHSSAEMGPHINSDRFTNFPQQGGMIQLCYRQVGPDGQFSYTPIAVKSINLMNPTLGLDQKQLHLVVDGASLKIHQQDEASVLAENTFEVQSVPSGHIQSDQHQHLRINSYPNPALRTTAPMGNCTNMAPVFQADQQNINIACGNFDSQINCLNSPVFSDHVNSEDPNNQLFNGTMCGMENDFNFEFMDFSNVADIDMRNNLSFEEPVAKKVTTNSMMGYSYISNQ